MGASSILEPALVLTISGLAVWLVPQNSNSFSSIIDSLSETYSTPPFSPHITLLSSINIPPINNFQIRVEKLLEVIQTAVEAWQQEIEARTVVARIEKVSTTPNAPFQYLYLQLENSPSLLALQKHLDSAITSFEVANHLETPIRPIYFPHLSLMYGLDSLEHRRVVEDIITKGCRRYYTNC